jgi:hypothetical protein
MKTPLAHSASRLTGLLLAVAFGLPVRAAEPVVSNLGFSQRPDGSGLVDVHFDLTDADGGPLCVSIEASTDGGFSWLAPCYHLSGDVGAGVPAAAGRQAVWDAGLDLPGVELSALMLRLLASDEVYPGPLLGLPAG